MGTPFGTALPAPLSIAEARQKRPSFDATLREEEQLVLTVLTHPSGVGLDFFGGTLSAHRNEDGSFSIDWEEGNEEWHKAFVASDAEGAARFFVEKRYERKIGFEFECVDDPRP